MERASQHDETHGSSFGGSSFGAYQVGEKVGSGGMAVVHCARQVGILGFDRTVALKRLLPSVSTRPEVVDMFVREATLASKLRHPNIVQIYELGVVDGTYFISMEFVDGWSLSEILRAASRAQAALPIEITIALLTQLCEALHYAHEAKDEHGRSLGLVHGDISLANVLVSRSGHLKVIDFGIARAERNTPDDLRIIKGKLGYMAPEVLTGDATSVASDIFAIGVVAHELVTGERLFGGRDDRSTVDNVLKMRVAPPSQRNSDCPPELDEIILSALCAAPTRRIASSAHLRDALEIVRRRYRLAASNVDVATWLETTMNRPRFRAMGTTGPWAQPEDSLSEAVPAAAIDYAEMSVVPSAAPSSGRTRWLIALALLAIVAAVGVVVGSPAVLSKLRATSGAAGSDGPLARMAAVNIRVEPGDAIVRIVGMPPSGAGSLELEPGIYSVSIERDGYQTWVSTIELDRGETKALSIALVELNTKDRSPRVAMISTPSGLRIEVDGEPHAERTPSQFTVAPGLRRVELFDGDKLVWKTTIDAVDSHLYQFAPDLRVEEQAERRERRRREERGRTRSEQPISQPDEVDVPADEKAPPDSTRTLGLVTSGFALESATRVDLPPRRPTETKSQEGEPSAERDKTRTIRESDVKRISGSIPTVRQSLIERAGKTRTGAILVCISKTGRVQSARALNKKLPKEVNGVMVAAIKKWRYTPYREAGLAVPACFSVVFGLRGASGR